MKRYILTGTAGAGKTTVLGHLAELGYATIPEAATDVIAQEQAGGRAEPWLHEDFIDKVFALQRRRQADAADAGIRVQFYDRSPVCTYALSVLLEREPTALLRSELRRIASEEIYETSVFFVCNLGFCQQTAARRMTFDQAVAFEQLHRDSYRELGYRLIDIPVAPAAERAKAIIDAIG